MSAGKGSSPRPYSVPADEFAARHESIFGRKERKVYTPPAIEKSDFLGEDEKEISNSPE